MAVNNELGTVQPLGQAVADLVAEPVTGRGAAHRRRAGRPVARRRPADRTGRPGVGQRPQVRRAEGGRAPSSSATALGLVPADRRWRPGAGATQRDPERGRRRGHGGRPGRHRGRAPAGRSARVRACATGWATGWWPRCPDAVETGDRDRRVAGILHLRVPGVESEAAVVLLDEAGVAASAGRRLLERCGGAEPRAGGHGTATRSRPGRGCASPWVSPPPDEDVDHALARVPGVRRPPAKLGPCASWWPCPAESTRRSPRPWPPKPTGRPTWSAPRSSCGAATSDSGCCSVADVDDARRVADQLGIVHHVFNFSADFEAHVVDPYVAGHVEGRTPNPCIECNRHLKFDRLLDRAADLGFDAVATGHHARVGRDADGTWRLLPRGRPGQGPVLRAGHARPGPAGPHPLPGGGDDQGRGAGQAARLGLRTAAKPDSQDVCFIRSDAGRAGFLGERVPLHAGRLVDHDSGADLGEVAAVELVTVGQRRGMGHGTRRPPPLRDRRRRARPAGSPSDRPRRAPSAARTAHGHLGRRRPPPAAAPTGVAALAQCSAHGPAVPCTVRADGDGLAVRLRRARSAGWPRARRSPSTTRAVRSRGGLGGGAMSRRDGRRRWPTTRSAGPPSCGR